MQKIINKDKLLFNGIGSPGKPIGALFLEYLESGPTTQFGIRLVKCNHFGQAEPEIHLEFRGEVWLPFYYLNEVSGNEIRLYHRIGNELLVNHAAGLWLIEMVGLFELSLLAEGFIEELNGNLYQSLLARMAGVA